MVVANPDRAWLVLVGDVSYAVHVRGHAQLQAALVLDVSTGLVRGVAVAPSDIEALAAAFTTALSKPAGHLAPGQPDRVLCGPGVAAQVADVLGGLAPSTPLPPITEVAPGQEAEDIFDSFIGHMAGRAQPEEPPGPEDWQLLFDQTLAYFRTGPWTRWSDGIDLALELTVAGEIGRHVAVVMGNAGLQRGLVLYPGEAAPAGVRDFEPGKAVPTPAGTLICALDPPGEQPADLAAKAVRYGWPTDAELVPAFLSAGPDEGSDLDRAGAQRLTVAIAAVLAHDARGPILAHPARQTTTGSVLLAGGQRASFGICQRPQPDEQALSGLRVHRVGSELVPVGTAVVLGHLTWAALAEMRGDARLHRPAPSDAPVPAGGEVPLVAVLTKRREGDRIAAKIAELDPFGIAVVEVPDGQSAITVVGKNGAELVMEVATSSPALAVFRRRMRETKGRHLVMIADEALSSGQGQVYGLFECHQPPPSREKTRSLRSPKARPKGRRG